MTNVSLIEKLKAHSLHTSIGESVRISDADRIIRQHEAQEPSEDAICDYVELRLMEAAETHSYAVSSAAVQFIVKAAIAAMGFVHDINVVNIPENGGNQPNNTSTLIDCLEKKNGRWLIKDQRGRDFSAAIDAIVASSEIPLMQVAANQRRREIKPSYEAQLIRGDLLLHVGFDDIPEYVCDLIDCAAEMGLQKREQGEITEYKGYVPAWKVIEWVNYLMPDKSNEKSQNVFRWIEDHRTSLKRKQGDITVDEPVSKEMIFDETIAALEGSYKYLANPLTDSERALIRDVINVLKLPMREQGEMLDNEPEKILELFMNADMAFEHGDDVNQMLSFGEATKRIRKYFHDKANGLLPKREAGEQARIDRSVLSVLDKAIRLLGDDETTTGKELREVYRTAIIAAKAKDIEGQS